jgi:hypothetical protein
LSKNYGQFSFPGFPTWSVEGRRATERAAKMNRTAKMAKPQPNLEMPLMDEGSRGKGKLILTGEH